MADGEPQHLSPARPQESATSRIRLPLTAQCAHNGDGRVHTWPQAGKWNCFPAAEEPCTLAAGNGEWGIPPTAARGASNKLCYPRNSLARSGVGSRNSHRDGTRAPPRPLGLPCGEGAYNALLTSAATEAQPGHLLRCRPVCSSCWLNGVYFWTTATPPCKSYLSHPIVCNMLRRKWGRSAFLGR